MSIDEWFFGRRHRKCHTGHDHRGRGHRGRRHEEHEGHEHRQLKRDK